MIKAKCNICDIIVNDINGFGICWEVRGQIVYILLFEEDNGDMILTKPSDLSCKRHICRMCINQLSNEWSIL